jgi:hypothetical protein
VNGLRRTGNLQVGNLGTYCFRQAMALHRIQGLSRPDTIAGRKAQALSKVCDRVRSKTLKAQKCFVGCFTNLADCLQARGRQHVPNARGESNVFDRSVVRQFRRWIDQMPFGHFAFAFSLNHFSGVRALRV